MDDKEKEVEEPIPDLERLTQEILRHRGITVGRGVVILNFLVMAALLGAVVFYVWNRNSPSKKQEEITLQLLLNKVYDAKLKGIAEKTIPGNIGIQHDYEVELKFADPRESLGDRKITLWVVNQFFGDLPDIKQELSWPKLYLVEPELKIFEAQRGKPNYIRAYIYKDGSIDIRTNDMDAVVSYRYNPVDEKKAEK